jgi:hypothetical protein
VSGRVHAAAFSLRPVFGAGLRPRRFRDRLDLTVPRAASRLLRFLGPGGAAVRGVTVDGLVPLLCR